jgi:hypothetical protein
LPLHRYLYGPEAAELTAERVGDKGKAEIMAIARCEKHPIQRETKEPYIDHALPIGFPVTAAICGRVGCENPALIWLTSKEVDLYKAGQRVFGVKTHSIRVRVAGRDD